VYVYTCVCVFVHVTVWCVCVCMSACVGILCVCCLSPETCVRDGERGQVAQGKAERGNINTSAYSCVGIWAASIVCIRLRLFLGILLKGEDFVCMCMCICR